MPLLENLPLLSRDHHLRRALRNAFHTSYLLRQRAENLAVPLNYPDPSGEFYGYEQWGMYLGGRAFGPGVRTLVSCATSWATASVLLETDCPYVTSKAHSIQMYHQYIGDQWSAFLQELFTRCKLDWNYHIPETAFERAQLHQLCTSMLVFENAFLIRCREEILSLISRTDPHIRWVGIECLQRIIYSEREFAQALQRYSDQEDAELQKAIQTLERKIRASATMNDTR